MAPKRFHTVSKVGKLQFYCPLCKHHQRTSTIQRMGGKHHFQLAVLTLACLVIGFPLFGWNSLLFYLVFWAGFDFFYRVRKRQALVCESCGFDPFLFKQDPHAARKALRLHWETRIAKENLFRGKKLKNYKTEPKAAVEGSPPPAAFPSQQETKNGAAPPLNTP